MNPSTTVQRSIYCENFLPSSLDVLEEIKKKDVFQISRIFEKMDAKILTEYLHNPWFFADCISHVVDDYNILIHLLRCVRKLYEEEEYYQLLRMDVSSFSLCGYLFFESRKENRYDLLCFLRSQLSHEQLFCLLQGGELGGEFSALFIHSSSCMVSVLRWVFQEYSECEVQQLFIKKDRWGSLPLDWILGEMQSEQGVDVISIISKNYRPEWGGYACFHFIDKVAVKDAENVLTALLNMLGRDSLYSLCVRENTQYDFSINALVSRYKRDEIPQLLTILGKILGEELFIQLLQAKSFTGFSLFEKIMEKMLPHDAQIVRQIIWAFGAHIDFSALLRICRIVCFSEKSLFSMIANMDSLDVLHIIDGWKYRDHFLWEVITIWHSAGKDISFLLGELYVTKEHIQSVIQCVYTSRYICKIVSIGSHSVQLTHVDKALDIYEHTLDGNLSCELLLEAWIKHNPHTALHKTIIEKIVKRFYSKYDWL